MVFARWADMTGGRVVFASPDQCTVESNVRAASTTGPPALGCGIIRRLQIGFGHVNPAGAVCAGNDPAYSLRHFQHTTSRQHGKRMCTSSRSVTDERGLLQSLQSLLCSESCSHSKYVLTVHCTEDNPMAASSEQRQLLYWYHRGASSK